MRLTELRKIAAARTPDSWIAASSREQLRKNLDYHTQRICETSGIKDVFSKNAVNMDHKNAEFIATAANTYDQLLRVAEAAKYVDDNLINWYMDHNKEALKDAMHDLAIALAALEADLGEGV